MEKITSPEQLKALHESIVAKRDPDKACVTVCAGTGCLAYGTQKLIDNFKDEIKEKNLEDTVSVRSSGCHGFCERGPIVVNYPEKTFYQKVGLDDAAEIHFPQLDPWETYFAGLGKLSPGCRSTK